jgi:hypothetical protein
LFGFLDQWRFASDSLIVNLDIHPSEQQLFQFAVIPSLQRFDDSCAKKLNLDIRNGERNPAVDGDGVFSSLI